MPFGIWDLPGPGLKPMSFALADGFLTTGPPGKGPKEPFLKGTIQGRLVHSPHCKTAAFPSPHTDAIKPRPPLGPLLNTSWLAVFLHRVPS